MSRLLSHRVATGIGDMSYSLYLWHWPIIVFARAIWPENDAAAILAAMVSFVPAWLSYRHVENPIRRQRELRGRRAFALAAVCIAVPAVACLALARVVLPGRSREAAARVTALSQRHADEIRHCDALSSLDRLPARCTWKVPNSRGGIILIGDSNAGQFTEPAAFAAQREGYDFSVAARHGCRFASVLVRRSGRPDRACVRYVKAAVQTLIRSRPALLVIASSTPEIINQPKVVLEDIVTKQRASTIAAKERLWETGLERALRPLANAQIPIVVVHTIPQFPSWQPNCAAIRAYLDPASCGTSMARRASDRFRHAALVAEDVAARAVPGATTIDFADRLCTRTMCRTNLVNHWLYRDGNHLSRVGAMDLTDEFERLFAAHARPEPSSDRAVVAVSRSS